jgi:hypothetical protein
MDSNTVVEIVNFGPVRFAFFPNERSSSRSRRKTNQNEQGVTSTLAIITSTLAIKQILLLKSVTMLYKLHVIPA